MRWVGHVILTREKKNTYRALSGNLREGLLQDQGIGGKIILKINCKEVDWEAADCINLASGRLLL
jgi:hypothetical protein